MTGERIRDKIAASKRKGMWMGGPVPLGYRVEQRKLVVYPEEAETVRHIFRRYLELQSIPALVDDLARGGYHTAVQLREDAVNIQFSASSNPQINDLSVPAKLVRKGHQLKLVASPDNREPAPPADPVLVKLIAQGFAARDYLAQGKQHPCVSGYSRRHLNRLARLAWLAPDIISDILGGRQPAHLTGRYLLRCGDMPLDWQGQRAFLGFA